MTPLKAIVFLVIIFAISLGFVFYLAALNPSAPKAPDLSGPDINIPKAKEINNAVAPNTDSEPKSLVTEEYRAEVKASLERQAEINRLLGIDEKPTLEKSGSKEEPSNASEEYEAEAKAPLERQAEINRLLGIE